MQHGGCVVELSNGAMLQTARAYLRLLGADVDIVTVESAWERLLATPDDELRAPHAKWIAAIHYAIAGDFSGLNG